MGTKVTLGVCYGNLGRIALKVLEMNVSSLTNDVVLCCYRCNS